MIRNGTACMSRYQIGQLQQLILFLFVALCIAHTTASSMTKKSSQTNSNLNHPDYYSYDLSQLEWHLDSSLPNQDHALFYPYKRQHVPHSHSHSRSHSHSHSRIHSHSSHGGGRSARRPPSHRALTTLTRICGRQGKARHSLT